MKHQSLLLVEDNTEIAGQLKEFFHGLGWALEHASSARAGLQLALENSYDVVLLDLNLPDGDGVELCQQIRQRAKFHLPVLMLTARDSFEDKAAGFGEGADDYVVKPFDFRELALRCQALARRGDLHRENSIAVGELVIDRRTRQAVRDGRTLALTRIGFDILLALAEAYPDALTRSQLHHRIWQGDPPDSDALRSHIYALRRELDKPSSQTMLTTIINIGYRLDV